MEKITKILFIAIIGIFSFTVLLLFNSGVLEFNAEPVDDTPQEPVHDLTLIVEYNNGSIKKESGFTLDAGETSVLDALKKFCDVTYIEYSNGDVFIEAIDGLANESPKYWQYWINGKYAQVSASAYLLNDSTIIEWKYGDNYYS